jgi:lantibiotic modifying enzyme
MSARFVMRASAFYALMLKEMHSPAGCASLQGREGVLADLNTHFKDHPEYLPVVEWERACLEEGDIPYLSFRAGESGLYGDPREEKLLDSYFKMTALDRCLLCIDRSSPEEKRFELDYIRRRFRQGPDVLPEAVGKSSAESLKKEPDEIPAPAPAEEARKQALKILDGIWELAMQLTDGDLILLSADKHLVPEYHMNFMRGLPGMSLFFDRIRTAFPAEAYGGTARKASCLLEATKKDLLRSVSTYQMTPPALRYILHPGIRKGAAGLFLSPCLEDRMLREILTALNLLDRSYDAENPGLASGIGGLLLGCTAAYDRTRDPELKETLMALMKRLTALLRDKLNDPEPCSGLNHGMSGVGLALVQAHRLTGNDDCLEMAEKAFLLENAQYRGVLGGWPDYGRSRKPVILGEHLEAGAPGIALAAVMCEQKVSAAKQLADRALTCTLRLPFRETDDLATGNAGIALTLTAAACRRGNPELLRAAGVRLAEMAARAERDGGYRSLPCRLRNAPDPAFWYGSAGIGFAMLVYAETLAE